MRYKQISTETTSDGITGIIVQGSSDYYSRGNDAQIDVLQGKIDTLTNLIEVMFKALPPASQQAILDEYGISKIEE